MARLSNSVRTAQCNAFVKARRRDGADRPSARAIPGARNVPEMTAVGLQRYPSEKIRPAVAVRFACVSDPAAPIVNAATAFPDNSALGSAGPR